MVIISIHIFLFVDSDEESDDNELPKEDAVSNHDSDDHWDEISEIGDVDSGQEPTQDIDMDDAE